MKWTEIFLIFCLIFWNEKIPAYEIEVNIKIQFMILSQGNTLSSSRSNKLFKSNAKQVVKQATLNLQSLYSSWSPKTSLNNIYLQTL